MNEIDQFLAEIGMRRAGSDESGWYVNTPYGKVWATDEPIATPIHPDNSLHYDGPDPLETRSVVPAPEWVEAANRARNAKRPTAITPGELGVIAARAEVGAAPAPSMGMIRLNALIEREANIRLIAEDAARRDLIDISPDPLAVDRRATLRRCFINDAMREKIFKRSRPDAVNVIWDYAFYMGFDTPNF